MYLIVGKKFSGTKELGKLLEKKGLKEAKFHTNKDITEKNKDKYIFTRKYVDKKDTVYFNISRDGKVKYLPKNMATNKHFLFVKPYECYEICKSISMFHDLRRSVVVNVIYVNGSSNIREDLLKSRYSQSDFEGILSYENNEFQKFDFIFLTGEYQNTFTYEMVRNFYDIENDYKNSLKDFVEKTEWGK